MNRVFQRLGLTGKNLVTSVPYLWLLLFFLVPFVIVLKISFSTAQIAMPPYAPLLHWVSEKVVQVQLDFGNFLFLVQDNLYWKAYLTSIGIAFVSTVFCLLIGYPIAYSIARSDPSKRNILMLLIVLPFWTSFLLRVYAWIGILKSNGLLNNFLMWLGVIHEPLQILQTYTAVYIGIVYSYLPFMILPLYANLEKMDITLLEAAYDLGCRPWQAFYKITLPLSVPGIVAGCLLVFIPAVGEFVIPSLLGSPGMLMIGKVLWTEFFNNRDWPVASAVAIALLLFLVIPIMYYQRAQDAESGGGLHR
ncbi:MAG: ABC transporter permease subunit [Steroidobacteraceae bacterium]|nr:ABC transporter permease subunit [Steroidobacteraceae bacterium]